MILARGQQVNVPRAAVDIVIPCEEERGPLENKSLGDGRCPEPVEKAFGRVPL